jgi:hypothetical protein
VLVLVVFVVFLAVVAMLSWRLRDSPFVPRTCCSARRWPPDDLTVDRHPQ